MSLLARLQGKTPLQEPEPVGIRVQKVSYFKATVGELKTALKGREEEGASLLASLKDLEDRAEVVVDRDQLTKLLERETHSDSVNEEEEETDAQ